MSDPMTTTPGASELAGVLRAHLPRDRYDDEGHSAGTYCTCGGWEGDYFADGQAGPFDDHLAAAVLAHLRAVAADEGVRVETADAVDHQHWCESNYTKGCNCGPWRHCEAKSVVAAYLDALEPPSDAAHAPCSASEPIPRVPGPSSDGEAAR